MSQITVIDEHNPEWNDMWEQLAKHQLNADNPNPYSCTYMNESWQYMETANGEHIFRHRIHPKTKNREYLRFPAKVFQMPTT